VKVCSEGKSPEIHGCAKTLQGETSLIVNEKDMLQKDNADELFSESNKRVALWREKSTLGNDTKKTQ